MSNINSRVKKLETQQGAQDRPAWKDFIQLDGAAWDAMQASDPELAAQWEAFTASPSDEQRLALMFELSDRIAAQPSAQDNPRAALPLAIAEVRKHEQP